MIYSIWRHRHRHDTICILAQIEFAFFLQSWTIFVKLTEPLQASKCSKIICSKIRDVSFHLEEDIRTLFWKRKNFCTKSPRRTGSKYRRIQMCKLPWCISLGITEVRKEKVLKFSTDHNQTFLGGIYIVVCY